MSTLLDYLSHAAALYPDNVAVEDSNQRLTYRELDDVSNRIAASLARRGARTGERVAILLPQGADAITAIWGVLKTGACYVPLDVAHPPERLTSILNTVAPVVTITDDSSSHGSTGSTLAATAVPINAARESSSSSFSPPALRPDDRAYILHTSGSTGIPKGVMLTHRNGAAFVDWAVETFNFTPSDRIIGHAPLHFDLSILDIFGAAHAGATLMPLPRKARVFATEFAAFIRTSQATVLYCVPSALTMLGNGGVSQRDLTSLRLILFAGENCPPATLRTMLTLAPNARFANLYGPTETNVCTFYEIDRAKDVRRETLPIGRSITPDTHTRIVGADGSDVAVGEPGELVVSGPTVAEGYWSDPDLTATRFSENTHGAGSYRTGDIVIRDTDDLLYLRGRADRQIKTRGYRVELDEIENALNSHADVTEAAVFAVPDEAITHRIVAVIVTNQTPDVAHIKRDISGKLPSYMLPEKIQVVDSFPRTSTGKLDRRALDAQIDKASDSG